MVPRMTSGMALVGFAGFSALMGTSLSYLPLVYSVSNMGLVLAATVGMFGATALFGYVTKKDLSGMGQFLVMALSQVLGVGTMALIAHATGRKDRDDANLVFNQSLLLGGACGIATLVAGYALTGPYLRSLAADAATVEAGIQYLHWFLPGLALQFALVPLASALRGTGIAMPTMVVQLASVAAARLRLSKFEACLPQRMLDEYVAGMLDAEAARRAVRRGASVH